MPAHVYKNALNKRVPSVTTITGRFKESGGLMYWANQEGLAGRTLEESYDSPATIGTLVHELVEAHTFNKKISDEINPLAQPAFDAYLQWESMVSLTVVESEVPLVSEVHDYGGRIDAIGTIEGELVLVDWKTGKLYPEHLLQVAAYKMLWEEHNPGRTIEGIHICSFKRETGDFSHNYFRDVTAEMEVFLTLRDLYTKVALIKKRV